MLTIVDIDHLQVIARYTLNKAHEFNSCNSYTFIYIYILTVT